MKAHEIESIEQSFGALRTDQRDLARKLDELAQRVHALEAGTAADRSGPTPSPGGATDEEAESLWSWVGQSRLLPRVAMVCFVLGIALVLRTLTDSGTIGVEVGVLLGVVYSALLVAAGWVRLARQRPGRTVLPACGAALMCAVVVEAHGPFELLPAMAAHGILLATLVVVAVLGIGYRSGPVIVFAILPTAISALTLGSPSPHFPAAAAVLLAANGMAMLAALRRRVEWLPFATLAVTVFFWFLWGFKANAALRREDEVVPEELFLEWYLPVLAVFAGLFAVVAAVRVLVRPSSPGAFHVFVPSANVLWAYPAALAIVVPLAGQATTLGVTGIAVAVAHFGVAASLWRRRRESVQAITAFAVAGAVLLSMAVLSATGEALFALPLWAAVALGLGAFAAACRSASVRVLAFGLQAMACAWAAAGPLAALPAPSPALAVATAAILAAAAAAHFRSYRRHPAPATSLLARFDPTDRFTVGLLWMAAVHAFLLLRLLAYAGIDALGLPIDNALQGAQSMIINIASVVLMLWGLRARDKQLLATAGLVATVGGLKVFFSDLQTAHGIPLVLAVLTLGMAAAVGSVVLGRWQRIAKAKEPE